MSAQPPKPAGSTSYPTNRLLVRVAAVGYAILLAVASLLPGNRLPTIPNWSDLFSPDKVAHFGAYALFALLLSVCTSERGRTKGTVWSVVVAITYGTLIEVLQGVAGTGRQSDPVDAFANTLGALLGGLIGYLLYPYLEIFFRPRSEISE